MSYLTAFFNFLRTRWRNFHIHNRILVIALLLFLGLTCAFMIWHGVFFSPDRFFVIAFLGVLMVGKADIFLLDWVPPLFLLMGYEYVRGLVPLVVTKIHIRAMIYFDKTVFGVVPTVYLQRLFFSGNEFRWYDYMSAILYLLHFVSFMMIAFFFWLLDRRYFRQYVTAMVVVSFMAFLTYMFFPAMPPWMASQQGFLPPVTHITNLVTAHFAGPLNMPTLYQYFGVNLVAAVPSLHAAYPLMTFLFLRKRFPRAGWAFLPYVLGVWLAVVYLGEHYVFDIVVAIIYVCAVYYFINHWKEILRIFYPLRKQVQPN
jgi:hypothetical protein